MTETHERQDEAQYADTPGLATIIDACVHDGDVYTIDRVKVGADRYLAVWQGAPHDVVRCWLVKRGTDSTTWDGDLTYRNGVYAARLRTEHGWIVLCHRATSES